MVNVLLVIGSIAGVALLVVLGRYAGSHPSFVQAEVAPAPPRRVGAFILGGLALGAVCWGIGVFSVAQSAMHEIEGLLLFLTASVLLSSAVIVSYLAHSLPKEG